MEDKIFIGNANAKQIQTSKGPWNILEISFKREQLEEMLAKYTNEKGYCNLKCYAKKQASEWSTHTIEVNTWGLNLAPQPQQAPQVAQQGGTSVAQEQAGTDIPF